MSGQAAEQKRALVIAHEIDGPARQIEVRLLERGFTVDTHLVTEDYDQPDQAQPWPDVSDYDIVLPMGSVRSLTRKDEIASWIHDELNLLRDLHAQGTPMLGVCFGGQLLAEALGGSVEVAPVTEIGWYAIETPAGAEDPAGSGPWMEWHHDRFTPPPDAEVLAVNENAVQLFRVGTAVGTQFHPEVDAEHIATWLTAAGDEYIEAYGVDKEQMLADANEHEERNIKQCHALVDWFLDEVAFP